MRGIFSYTLISFLIIGFLSALFFVILLPISFASMSPKQTGFFRKAVKWSGGIFFVSTVLWFGWYFSRHSVWSLYTFNSKLIGTEYHGRFWTLGGCQRAGDEAIATPIEQGSGWEGWGRRQPEGYYCGFNCSAVGLDGHVCSMYRPSIQESREKVLNKLSPEERAHAEEVLGWI